MNDIAEIERRIGQAIDRIAHGLRNLGGAGAATDAGGDGELEMLRQALDDERTANAQLTERVRAVREKQESVVATLERTVQRLTEQLEVQGRELQRQKRLNDQLTETNRTLNAAAASGVSEPHLINKAMMSELEALRLARAAERAEMDEILNELKPLIGEVA